jgi:hypothetical protein
MCNSFCDTDDDRGTAVKYLRISGGGEFVMLSCSPHIRNTAFVWYIRRIAVECTGAAPSTSYHTPRRNCRTISIQTTSGLSWCPLNCLKRQPTVCCVRCAI